MSKKICAVLAVLLILCSLSGCAAATAQSGKLDGSDSTDYGYVEGYYSQLAYEVKNDNGDVTEQMYFLCTDAEFEDPVGKKSVYFDDKGKMNKYTITMGVLQTEWIINYVEGDNGSSYFSEMHYGEDEKLLNGKFDNNYTNADGVLIREVGEQEYYEGSAVMKRFFLEEYRDGSLYQTTERLYDEAGKMTSESIS